MTANSPSLTRPFRRLLRELTRERYQTHTVKGFFHEEAGRSDKANVVFRIDVDFSLPPVDNLTRELAARDIDASIFFLTDEDRHYPIWDSSIPCRIARRGFEVGLHTDHYYSQLTEGESAIQGIRRDVEKLTDLVGSPVEGMVFHGHPDMDALGRRNWDPYKHLLPEDLGLAYHDGYTTGYADPNADRFLPRTDHLLPDSIGHNNSWQRYPNLPRIGLRRVQRGESVHLVVHPANAYDPTPEPVHGLSAIKPLLRVHRYRIWALMQLFGTRP